MDGFHSDRFLDGGSLLWGRDSQRIFGDIETDHFHRVHAFELNLDGEILAAVGAWIPPSDPKENILRPYSLLVCDGVLWLWSVVTLVIPREILLWDLLGVPDILGWRLCL